MKPLRALVLPAALLAAAQVWHAVTPVKDELDAHGKVVETGVIGFFGGILLLLACIVAAIAARQGREWARPLSLAAGLGVSIGFLLYHATTLHSPVTNPYFGRPNIGIVQLAPVFACMAIGAWLAVTAWPLKAESRSTATV